MKLLLSSDWHLRGSNPENRVDNFFLSQLRKVEQIFQIFNKEKCQYLLQAGDLFDCPRPSFEVIQYIIKLFKEYRMSKENFICVSGQHDARYRQIDRTAFKLMETLDYTTICKKMKLSEDTHLYGVSWGDEIPIIEDINKFNILLIHKTIVSKQQFIGQENYLQSDKLFKKYPYDIVLAGDNHIPVFFQYKEQTIIGCGTISRKTVGESDLIPHIYLLDITENDLTYSLDKIELEYESAEKVFRPEALTRETTKENAKLKEFIESIKNNEIGSSLDFKKNLEIMMKTSTQEIKDIIIKSFEEIIGENK